MGSAKAPKIKETRAIERIKDFAMRLFWVRISFLSFYLSFYFNLFQKNKYCWKLENILYKYMEENPVKYWENLCLNIVTVEFLNYAKNPLY